MKKVLIALALSLISTPVMAQAPSTVQLDCTKYTDSNNTPPAIRDLCFPEKPAITPEDVREWGTLGKEFSEAIVETAKGLGVAANDFLNTPVGFLIAFYFLWDTIGGILIGIPLIIALWCLYFNIMRSASRDRWKIEYEFVPILWGAFSFKRIKAREWNTDDSGETAAAYILVGLGCMVITAILLGTLVF